MNVEQIWPEWHTERAIGKGSYGTVYKCFKNTENGKEYSAIKVISIPQDDFEAMSVDSENMSIEQSQEYYKDVVDDFLSEIKILESLKGIKNIVDIQDSKIVEKDDGIGWQIFIRMELLTDFNTYTSDKKFSEEDTVKLALDLCDALIACGEKKIIHRDIKPENIFVDAEGNFKLGDFGVAKQLEKTYASMSRKGTYNYMAPEVLSAKKYDSRADIYSLGIVMYKLLNNNRLPFLDPDKQVVRYNERQEAFEKRIRGEKIPPLEKINPQLNEIVLKACAFKPDERCRTVAEFKAELERFSGGKKNKPSLQKIIKKNKVFIIIAAALVVAVIAGTAIYFSKRNSPDKNNDEFFDTSEVSEIESAIAGTTVQEDEKSGNEGVFEAFKKVLDDHSYNNENTGEEEYPAYHLFDIDGDGICELFLYDRRIASSTDANVTVYKINAGENVASPIGSFSIYTGHTEVFALPEENAVVSRTDFGDKHLKITKTVFADGSLKSTVVSDKQFEAYHQFTSEELYDSICRYKLNSSYDYDSGIALLNDVVIKGNNSLCYDYITDEELGVLRAEEQVSGNEIIYTAYSEILSTVSESSPDDNLTYYVYDINNDGVAELFARSTDDEIYGWDVYSFQNDKAVKYGTIENSFSYLIIPSDGNGLILESSKKEFCSRYRITEENGRLVQKEIVFERYDSIDENRLNELKDMCSESMLRDNRETDSETEYTLLKEVVVNNNHKLNVTYYNKYET